MDNEWQLSDQADVIGYSSSECQLTPNSEFPLQAPTALFWHASVGPALVGDTILLHDSSNEQLTRSSSWPHVAVQVKGREVLCPGILRVRNSATASTEAHVETSLTEKATASLFDCPELPHEDGPSRVESVWELELPSFRSARSQDG